MDKGYTEAYTDSDGERHGEGLGDLLSAESDHRKVKDNGAITSGHRAEHRAKGNHRKADTIRKNNLGHQKWGPAGGPCTTSRCATTSARPPHRRGQAGTICLRGPVRVLEVRQVPPQGHHRRLSGWVKA